MDDGEILQQALRAFPDIRRLILPLGFAEVEFRAFRSGALSAGGDVGERKGGGVVSSVSNPGGVEMSQVVGTGQKTL